MVREKIETQHFYTGFVTSRPDITVLNNKIK